MKLNKTFRELAGNTLIFMIAEFSSKLISFVMMPIITLNLTPEMLGKAEYIVNLSELLYPLFTVGLTDALLRFTIKDKNNIGNSPVDILASCTIVGLIGTVILGLGFLIKDGFAFSINSCLCFILFISVFFSTFLGQYLRGIDFNLHYALSGIIRSVSLLVTFLIFVVKMGLNYKGYVLSIIASNFISMFYMMSVLLIKKLPIVGHYNKTLTKRMLRYSLPLIPNMLCWWGIQLSNKYFLTYFYDIGMFGIYTSISKIATLINIVSIIFCKAWTVSAVKINDEKEYSLNTVIFRLYSSVIILGTSCLLVLLPFVSRILLKGEFFDYWSFSTIAILIATFNCYGSFFGPFYGVNYNNVLNLFSTLTGLITILIFSLFLIPGFGLLGALIASLLGYIALFLFRYYSTKTISNIKINYILEIASCILLIVQGFVAFKLTNNLNKYYVFNTILFIVLFIINFKSMINNIKRVLN